MNAESALLSQILQDNDIFYHTQPKPWWFLSSKNRAVLQAIETLLTQAECADVFSVGEKVGNLAYVSSLSSVVPTTANYKYYALECQRLGAIEQLKGLGEIIKTVAENGQPDEVYREIDTVMDRLTTGEEYKITPISETLGEIINTIEDRFKKRGVLPGISTGFDGLDDMIDGLQKEKLYVIGARPSQGKSAIMLNMASHIADKHKVGIISLESSWKEIVIRELSTISGINSQKLSRGFFKELDFQRLTSAAEKIYEKKLFLYDKPNCHLLDVVGQARRMVQRHGVEILFIDYIQLIQTKADSDRERVATASKRVKDLARELHIPIVALAQLSRSTDGRRPLLGDFQHTSQIEQDIDVGMLLYHRVTGPDGKKAARSKPEEGDTLNIFLLVDKNRDGRTGAMEVTFDAERVRFVETNANNR